MMAAMIGLKRSRGSFYGEILFMAVADEETGSQFGTVYLLQKGIGRGAHFAIVSEPTGLNVALGNRGLRWVDLLVKGKACHAGRPHVGVNAISYGAKLVEAIGRMRFDQRNDAFEIPYPSISVTTIHGGTKVNIIPNRCELSVDRRMIPGETTETVLAELKGVIDPVLAEEKQLQIEVKMRPVQWDPYLIAKDDPIVQATLRSIKDVTGKAPGVLGKSACTDGSYLFHMGGIPAALFGPGNELLSHQVDEWTSIENLVLSVEIFDSIFSKLLK